MAKAPTKAGGASGPREAASEASSAGAPSPWEAASEASSAGASGSAAGARDSWWLALLVLAAVLAALGGSLVASKPAELLMSDAAVVARTPELSGEALLRFFTEPDGGLGPDGRPGPLATWRPLTTTWVGLVKSVGSAEAGHFRAAALLLHAIAAIAALLLALRIFRERWIALAAALLFALHPVHVEAISWLEKVSHVLAGCLSIACLASFVRWRNAGSSRVPIAATVLFAMALLAHETAAATLLALFALDFAKASVRERSRGLASFARAYTPLVVVLLCVWLWRNSVLADAPPLDATVTLLGVALEPGRAALARIELFGASLGVLAWPTELSAFRAIPPRFDPTGWRFVTGVAAIVLLGLGSIACARRRAYVGLASILFLAAALVFPLFRLDPSGLSFPADSELYLAACALGFSVLVAARSLASRKLAPFAGIALAVVLALLSFRRAEAWRSEEALFRAEIAGGATTPFPHWSLGRVLLQRFREEGDPELLREALGAFERAQDVALSGKEPGSGVLATGHDFLQANIGVAWCYLYEAEIDAYHDYELPISIFEMLLDNQPTSLEALTGLGIAEMQAGRHEDAERTLRKAVRLDRRYVEAQRALAELYMRRGEWERARRQLETCLELRPNHLGDTMSLVAALEAGGWDERARDLAEQAAERYPDRAEPQVQLATLELDAGETSTALARLDKAIRMDPRNARAHALRGKALVLKQEVQGALESFRRACELDPRDFESHYNMGALLLNNQAQDAALPYLERAYSLGRDRSILAALRTQIALLKPESLELAYGFAKLDHNRGHGEESEWWLERALGIDPDHGPSHFLRGVRQRLDGEMEAAVESLRRAAEVMPDTFAVHLELGFLLQDMGRNAEALRELERAREIGPPPGGAPDLVEQELSSLDARIATLRESAASGG